MDKDKPDATWLFENRDPANPDTPRKSWRAQNSESWWTAVFTLFLFSFNENNVVLPFHIYKGNENFEESGIFKLLKFKYENLFVETSVSSVLALNSRLSQSQKDLSTLRPDIIIKERGKFLLIENKTVRARKDSLETYLEIIDKSKDIEFFLLISKGHWDNEIWKVIREHGLRLILWESVFKEMDDRKFSEKIFNKHLEPYYKQA